MSYDLSALPPLKRHWIVRNANIPTRFFGLGPEDVEEKIGSFAPEIQDWTDKFLAGKVVKTVGGLGTTGVGLLFDGQAGLGKTTHAVVALMEAIRQLPDDAEQAKQVLHYTGETYSIKSRPIYYMTFPEFLQRKKAIIEADADSKRNMILEMEGFHGRSDFDHLNVRLLVLDDLGKEYSTEYSSSGFDEVLRSRYDKGLPTIITTNVLRENWGKKYGDAMGSFVYEAFVRVIIGKKDLRRN